MFDSLRHNWPEYLMEATGLGIFMVSACVFTTIIEHPASPVRHVISSPFLRLVLIGVAMGLTAICFIYSPWGKQSGAHINPSVTLTFFGLGKVKAWDAVFYILAQFIGGTGGVLIAAVLLGNFLTDPSVNYLVTVPGVKGVRVAFVAEFTISFILMLVVLVTMNTRSLSRFTGLFVGALLATFISLEAPLSGASMNPARTFGPALLAHVWTGLRVYFAAPPLGMLLAAEIYLRVKGGDEVICAKLHHHNSKRCIFKNCGYRQGRTDAK